MPNRILRDGINSSPRVDSLSDGAEILYRRLISVVDDYGRFYASPGTLRGACWPLRPERVDEGQVRKWLQECCAAGLVSTYAEDRFLQISDFRQQVRSKSKFPDPDINCVANAEQVRSTSRSRSRISETESKTETAPARAATTAVLPRWKSDEAFARFAADYLGTGGAFIDADFNEAYEFCWRGLDFEQKLERVNALNRHAEEYHAEPRFVPKPRKFLETEWQRAPKPPAVSISRNGYKPAQPPPLPVKTAAEERKAFEYMAEHDDDPTAREYAKEKLKCS